MVHSISLSFALFSRLGKHGEYESAGERERSILVNDVFVVAVIYYYSDAACLAVQKTAQREREIRERKCSQSK